MKLSTTVKVSTRQSGVGNIINNIKIKGLMIYGTNRSRKEVHIY